MKTKLFLLATLLSIGQIAFSQKVDINGFIPEKENIDEKSNTDGKGQNIEAIKQEENIVGGTSLTGHYCFSPLSDFQELLVRDFLNDFLFQIIVALILRGDLGVFRNGLDDQRQIQGQTHHNLVLVVRKLLAQNSLKTRRHRQTTFVVYPKIMFADKANERGHRKRSFLPCSKVASRRLKTNGLKVLQMGSFDILPHFALLFSQILTLHARTFCT